MIQKNERTTTKTKIIKQKTDNQQRNNHPPPPLPLPTISASIASTIHCRLFSKTVKNNNNNNNNKKRRPKPTWGRGTQTIQTPNSPLLPFLLPILKLSPPQIEFWLFFCNANEQTNIFCFVCPVGYKK